MAVETLLWLLYRSGGLPAVGAFLRALDAAGVTV